MNEDIRQRRSKVRMNVTYLAALFVFFGAAAMIVYAFIVKDNAMAKDTFTVVLPIGTAVITYWFAGRSAEKASEKNQDGNSGGGENPPDQSTI